MGKMNEMPKVSELTVDIFERAEEASSRALQSTIENWKEVKEMSDIEYLQYIKQFYI